MARFEETQHHAQLVDRADLASASDLAELEAFYRQLTGLIPKGLVAIEHILELEPTVRRPAKSATPAEVDRLREQKLQQELRLAPAKVNAAKVAFQLMCLIGAKAERPADVRRKRMKAHAIDPKDRESFFEMVDSLPGEVQSELRARLDRADTQPDFEATKLPAVPGPHDDL